MKDKKIQYSEEGKLNSYENGRTNLNRNRDETYVRKCIKWFEKLRLDIIAK